MAELQRPPPVVTQLLFPSLLYELTSLLASLPAEDWHKPTACGDWTVKDVALHMLGGEIGNLSFRRDGHNTAANIANWDELVAFINHFNQAWVESARRISPRLLIELLQFTGGQLCVYFQSLDAAAMGGAVSWAGPGPAPVWLDLAREYTERWHHQQHVRDAVGKPGLKDPQYMAPVLAALVWAMPRAFAAVSAEPGTSVTLTINGPSGGRWTVVREADAWTLYAGAPTQPDVDAVIDEDAAWRLFTRGLNDAQSRAAVTLRGDEALGAAIFNMVSIIA
jgi:uncharacterized protein (TIGR03083 family)